MAIIISMIVIIIIIIIIVTNIIAIIVIIVIIIIIIIFIIINIIISIIIEAWLRDLPREFGSLISELETRSRTGSETRALNWKLAETCVLNSTLPRLGQTRVVRAAAIPSDGLSAVLWLLRAILTK